MVEIFADTANLEEIKEAVSLGFVTGVTTNPKIFSSEGKISMKGRVLEIIDIIDGPVSVEVISLDAKGMIREAKEYSSWHPNVVVKFPMGVECLKAMKEIDARKVKLNITACMSFNQALLAALNNAYYVSLFYGRIGDMGSDPYVVVRDTADVFKKNNIKSRIIVGSIRSLNDINRSILAGGDIITVPFKFLKAMAENPQTEKAIKEFTESWNAVK